jgi:hypothetical protein
VNLYGYCGGGPVGAADPWGLSPAGDFFVGFGQGILGGVQGTAEGYVDFMRSQALGVLSIPEQWDRFQQIPGQLQRLGENAVGIHGAGGVGEAAGTLVMMLLSKKVCELAPVTSGSRGAPWVRVGRVMSSEEYGAMQATGQVQPSRSAMGKDMTFVTNPASKGGYNGGKGGYTEFDVPSSNVAQGGRSGWGIVFGPKSPQGATRGSPFPGMPPFRNLGPFEDFL